ncbi:aspartate/glutamate racemase family protein [Paenibacillaceae bacterium WGS1546]|uniref:aspartate/glutamate racemase family protein n=1 Tax=Cohnella sp. WGS1546 TaxID=3366810 RepID=UPI00372D8419
MQTTVAAIYTGQGLAEPLQAIFREELPEVRLVHMIDDSLIADVIRTGELSPAIARRLVRHYHNAEELGADMILNTCSSVGEIADAAQALIGVPIVKIDDAMAQQAASNFERIGVLATLPSTLEPTMRLIGNKAKLADRQVKLVNGLADGAFAALVSGKPEAHDQLLLQTARTIADEVDVLVLAQGSMARMELELTAAIGKPVLSSPRLGVRQLKRMLDDAALA